MRIAIMQPYFMPYIGYFQLIESVDQFVIYDNIQYTKKGWINRNRYLKNGSDATFSIPLKKDSDYLDIGQRSIAPDFNRRKLLNQLQGAYRKAPQYDSAFPLIQQAIESKQENLFDYVHDSVQLVCCHLGIETPLVKSSTIEADHSLKSQDRVLAICSAMGADSYVNAIGGMELYQNEAFAAQQVQLRFLKTHDIAYAQFGEAFVPWLSILDVLMFNDVDQIRTMLSSYELVANG